MLLQQKFVIMTIMLLASLCCQTSIAHKVLLLNDIHLDIDSTVVWSDPGTEASPKTLRKILREAAKEEDKSG